MRGSNVQSLVKNGSQTSLDSKAFSFLHSTELRCFAGRQILSKTLWLWRSNMVNSLYSGLSWAEESLGRVVSGSRMRTETLYVWYSKYEYWVWSNCASRMTSFRPNISFVRTRTGTSYRGKVTDELEKEQGIPALFEGQLVNSFQVSFTAFIWTNGSQFRNALFG